MHTRYIYILKKAISLSLEKSFRRQLSLCCYTSLTRAPIHDQWAGNRLDSYYLWCRWTRDGGTPDSLGIPGPTLRL